ncbi:MAG: AsmA family protein [Mycobacteriales bacterium]
MRVVQILGIAAGIIVALIVVLLLAVKLFVNPNDYKGRIAQAVKTSTGRELDLSGDVKLSVFPWIALELGPARLGNPPGFGAEPFAAVRHASVRVKLLPLLRKQLQVGRIEIDGLDLRLRRNAAGKGNWDFSSAGSAETASSSGSSAQSLRELGGIAVAEGRVSYQDSVIDHLNLQVGRAASGLTVPVSVKLELVTARGAQPIELSGHFDVQPDVPKQQYRFASLELVARVHRPGTTPVDFKFSAPELEVDIDAQTLGAPAFSSQLAAARLAGALAGTRIIDAPSISGSFKLQQLSLRSLMGEMGVSAPAMRDPTVLGKFAASGEFSYGSNAARASHLVVLLDESTLHGDAAITNLDTKAMTFNLSLDRINLDRYLAPPKPASHQAAAPTAAKAGAAGADPFKTLQLNGTLAIGSARILNLNITDVRASVAAAGGVTHLAPASAKLYGGDYSGDIVLDDRASVAALKLDQRLSGVDVGALLKDFDKIDRISGRGTVTTSLTARGLTSDEITRSLNGRVAANLDAGAIEGIDLWFEVNRALALVQKQSLPGGSSSGRTRFDVFKTSADLTNWVAATRDLSIVSQNLRVAGQGTTNLVTGVIQYQVNTTILKPAPTARAPAATLADIPLQISGTMSKPQVRPDLEGIARTRVQQELEKHKGQLQQQLQGVLKGIIK